MNKKKDNPVGKEILLRAANYCAYQERCHEEVKAKLNEWEVPFYEVNEIILELIEQGYLNESRFARAFAGGKFRIRKWGRIKITGELKARKVSENCIDEGLREIDEASYMETLKKLAVEKYSTVTDRNPLVRKNKTARFLMGKGFEPDLVWDVLKGLFK